MLAARHACLIEILAFAIALHLWAPGYGGTVDVTWMAITSTMLAVGLWILLLRQLEQGRR